MNKIFSSILIFSLLGCSTSLHRAAEKNDGERIKQLIKSGKDVDEPDFFGYTPLHYAASHGSEIAINILLDNHANINYKAPGNLLTPLHLAAGGFHTTITGDGSYYAVKTLIDRGADVFVKDYKGKSPIHNAALEGYIDAIELLIKKGVNVNEGKDITLTPLHSIAVKNLVHGSKSVDTAKYLLSKGADINAKAKNGNTPLHTAAMWCNFEYMKFLINNGANVDLKNNNGQTALDVLNDYWGNCILNLSEKREMNQFLKKKMKPGGTP